MQQPDEVLHSPAVARCGSGCQIVAAVQLLTRHLTNYFWAVFKSSIYKCVQPCLAAAGVNPRILVSSSL